MNNRSKSMPWACRAIAAVLAALLASETCLADVGQSSLWNERRRAMAPARTTQLASAALPGHADVGRLLGPLPRPVSAGISPSITSQLERVQAPDLKKRLAEVVRALPPQTGTVRDVTRGESLGSGRIVVHIQDIHLNKEAQAHIAEAVRGLAVAGVAGVVGLEGAFGPVDLSAFRAFPDRSTMRGVADYLVGENKISGPVSVAMTEASAPPFVGADSKEHYDRNVAAYRRAAPRQAAVRQRILDRRRDLADRKRAVYSKRLARFDAAVAAYDNGDSPIGIYIRALASGVEDLPLSIQSFLSAYEIESGMDFTRVESERSRLLSALVQKLKPAQMEKLVADSLEYRMGRMGHGAFYAELRDLAAKDGVRLADYPAMDAYVRYVLLSDSIRPSDLYHDLDALRAADYRRLAVTDEERALVAEDERVGLALKLVNFSLTPEEWTRYDREPKGTLAFAGDLADFETFYREADARNDALTANLLRAMDEKKAKVGVLVTGGFHAPGVSARLARAGVSMISYVPRLSKVDVDGTAYLSVFTQEKAPLDRLFEGPKLFLAQDPAPAASLNFAAVLDAARASQLHTISLADLQAWFRTATGFQLRTAEATETGEMRVAYDRGQGEPVTVLIRAMESGGFEVHEDGSTQSFAALGDLRSAVAQAWDRAQQNARQVLNADRSDALTPTLRIVTFNSWALTAVVAGGIIGLAALFNPLSWSVAIAVIAITKLVLFISVVAHEMGHLAADGQLAGLSAVGKIRRGLSALNRKNLFLSFFLGTDITNAFIVSSNPELTRAENELGDYARQQIRFVAISGPAVNAVLIIASIGLVLAASIFLMAGWSGVYRVLILGGQILGGVNIALTVTNALWGTDFDAYRTGVAPGGIFRMALGPNGRSGNRSLEPDDPDELKPGETASGPIRRGNALVVGAGALPEALRIERTRTGLQATFYNGDQRESIPLQTGRAYYFGRHPTVDFAVDGNVHTMVSRFHVVVKVGQNGTVTVADLFSQNGTRIVAGNDGWMIRGAEDSEAAQAAPRQPASPGAPQAAEEPEEDLGSLHHTEFSVILDRSQKVPVNDLSAVRAPATPQEDTSLATVTRRVNEELPRLSAAPTANGDEDRQMDFFSKFLPILLRKHNLSRNEPWRAAVRAAIVGYMNEAAEIDEREVPVRGTLRADGPTRVSDAFSTNAEIGKKKRFNTTRISLKGNDSVRISVRMTETGVPLALGIDRHGSDGSNKPMLLSGSLAGLPMLGRYLVSLADVQYLSFDYDAEGHRVIVTLNRRGGLSQTVAFALPSDEDSAVPVAPAAPIVRAPARPEPPAPTRTDREAVVANTALLGGRAFDFAVARARARSGGAAQVDLDIAVDANGEIVANGERERFPAEVTAAIAAGTMFAARLRVRAPTTAGAYLTLISGDVPPEARRRLTISLEVQSDREARVRQLRAFNHQQLVGATPGILGSNINRIFSDNVETQADEQWYRGSAGDDEHAVLTGILRPNGELFSFFSPNEVPSAMRRAIDAGLLYAVNLRVRMVGTGDRYEVSIPGAPAATAAPVLEAVRLANGAVRSDREIVATDDLDIDAALARSTPIVAPAPARPVEPARPAAPPVGPVTPASRSEAEAEIDRQLNAFDTGIVLVFRGPTLPNPGVQADAFMVPEREVRRQLRAGEIVAVRRDGQVFLIYRSNEPDASLTFQVDASQYIPAARPRRPARVARHEADQSMAEGTVGMIRDRFDVAMQEIADAPEPDLGEQERFMGQELSRLAPNMFRNGERAAFLHNLVRLFSLRATPARVGPTRLYFSEDQGSGETVMPVNVEDYLGNGFLEGPEAESRIDLILALFDSFAERYRFTLDDELASERYTDRRARAVARWAARVPSFLRLVNPQNARPEMIYTAIEIFRRLPLNILNRTSNIANRLQRGIDLAAPRDRAARIGHYDDEDGGQLGIQPTIFQFREFIETVLHEFGHVSQENHLRSGSRLLQLFARARPNTYAIAALGFSASVRRGYIQSSEEMFAETFMHYVLHGELFSRGFPGYTRDTAAWRAVYAYYRDNVFGGVEFRNGMPTRPDERPAQPAARAPAVPPVQAPASVVQARFQRGRGEATTVALPARITILGAVFEVRGTPGNVQLARVSVGATAVEGLDAPIAITQTPVVIGNNRAANVRVRALRVAGRQAEVYLDATGAVVIHEVGLLPLVGVTGQAPGALTLPSTRAWAAAKGYDPDGTFTELVAAPWLEGRGFQHFLPGFLGQHGQVTPAMRAGVGVIWFVAILAALFAGTAVGVNVAPLLKSGSAVTLALAALAVTSIVASFVGGLWAGGIAGHFLYNAVTRLMRRFAPRLAERLGLLPLTIGELPRRLQKALQLPNNESAWTLAQVTVRGRTMIVEGLARATAIYRADEQGNWKEVTRFSRMTNVAVSDDGDVIAYEPAAPVALGVWYGGQGPTVMTFDGAESQTVSLPYPRSMEIALSRDGRHLFALWGAAATYQVSVFRIVEGASVPVGNYGVANPTLANTVSPEGRYVISDEAGQPVRVLDADDGLNPVGGTLAAEAFSPVISGDGSIVAFLTPDDVAHFYAVDETGADEIDNFFAPTTSLTRIEHGVIAVTGPAAGTPSRVYWAEGGDLRDLRTPFGSGPRLGESFSADGQVAAALFPDRAVVYRLIRGFYREIAQYPVVAGDHSIGHQIDLSPDGRTLAVIDAAGVAHFHRIAQNGIRSLGQVDYVHGEVTREVAYSAANFSVDGGEVRLDGVTPDGEVVIDRVGLASGAPMVMGQNDDDLSVSFHDYTWRLMVASAKGLQNNATDRSAPYNRFDRLATGPASLAEKKEDLPDLYIGLETGELPVVSAELAQVRNEVRPGALTLPSTRAWAAAKGFDPDGTFTELVAAPWLEGRGFQHFLPGFLGQHGQVTPAMRVGVGVIWFVGLLTALIAGTAVGVNVAPLLKTGSVAALALAALAVTSIVASFIGGLWAGGITGHFLYNAAVRAIRRVAPRLAERLGLRPLTIPQGLGFETVEKQIASADTPVLNTLASQARRLINSESIDERRIGAELTQWLLGSERTRSLMTERLTAGLVTGHPSQEAWAVLESFIATPGWVGRIRASRGALMELLSTVNSESADRILAAIAAENGTYPGEGRAAIRGALVEAAAILGWKKEDGGADDPRLLQATALALRVLRDENYRRQFPDRASALAGGLENIFGQLPALAADEPVMADALRSRLNRADWRSFLTPSPSGESIKKTLLENGAQLKVGYNAIRGADETAVVTYGPDNRVRSRNRKSLAVNWESSPFQGITTLAVTEDERLIATGDSEAHVRILDRATGKQLLEFSDPSNGAVGAIAFSPDARYVAAILRDGRFRVWDLHSQTNGAAPVYVSQGVGGPRGSQTLAFSPDGRWVVSGESSHAEIWDVGRGVSGARPVGFLPFIARLGSLRSFTFSPDGRFVVGGFDDGYLRFWDVSDKGDPKRLVQYQIDHNAGWDIAFSLGRAPDAGSIRTVAYSPDGAEILTATSRELSAWRVKPFVGGLLTLPSTRAWAAAKGFDPDGTFTELVAAPWLEGRGFQHFLPGFLGQHGQVTPAMRVGVGVIWFVGLLTALIAGTAVGVNVAPLLKTGSVATLALAALAVTSIVASFIGGLWAGGITGHFLYNAAVRLLRRFAPRFAERLGLRPLTVSQEPAARVGEGLIEAAVAIVTRRGEAPFNQLLGPIVDLHVGSVFVGNGPQTAVAPASVRREAVVAYVRANLDGRLKEGDLSIVEAQRVVETLSQWLGDTVTLGNKEVLVVVRDGTDAKADLDDVEKIVAARRAGEPPVDVVVSVDQQDEATRRFGGRANIVVARGAVITANNLDFGALQEAIQADSTGLRDRLSNALLVVSRDVSVSSQALPADSPLRAMGYKSLEDVVENLLTPLQVLPLGTVVDAARVLAVQA